MYQGTLKKAMQLYNACTGKKVEVPYLIHMHSNEMGVWLNIYYFFFRGSILTDGLGCRLYPVKLARCSVLSARLGILDGSSNFSMVRGHCLASFGFRSCPFQRCRCLFLSLSIKPKGLETLNFSRALNRFKKILHLRFTLTTRASR